jgi:hypothetical protein
MTGHEYRSDVEAAVHPGRHEGLVGGGCMQLVTLRLHDGPGVVDAITGEPANRRECPRICVGVTERKRHVYENAQQDQARRRRTQRSRHGAGSSGTRRRR